MKSGAPSATIVIPAHNESRFIGSLLKSIKQYGPRDAKIIVVDNGSTDLTAEIAAKFGAIVLSVRSRVTPSVARNLGVAHIDQEGELLIFLDADVELTPEWRDEWGNTHASLQSNPMQVTGGPYHISGQPSWIERVWFAPMGRRENTDIAGGNLITTRRLFHKINGFDIKLATGEDFDLCVRAREAGASVVLNGKLPVRHEGNPKRFSTFIKRERWHGAGCFATLRHVRRSPVALATVTFVLLHFLGLTSFLGALFLGRGYIMPLACLAAVVLLCAGSVFRMFPHEKWIILLQSLGVMYAYYFGRSLSIWDAIVRIGHKRPQSSREIRTHR